MLHIYNRTNKIWKKEFIKLSLSKILRKSRGPSAVMKSVTRGLSEINVQYKVNTPYNSIHSGDTVYVISGTEALKDILQIKAKIKNIKLIAGPTITVLPDEEDSLIKDKSIDVIVVPSQWVKDLYISTDKALESRIYVLPAGITVPETKSSRTDKDNDSILVYIKNAPEDLRTPVLSNLELSHIKYATLQYGNFKRDEYFEALSKSRAMIYLSPTESQGIALNEAWIRDVPTFVWSRGYWEHRGIIWKDPKISAPYLTDETGMFFENAQDFAVKFKEFLSKIDSFKPREHSLEHFTDAKCAQNLMCIIDSIKVY